MRIGTSSCLFGSSMVLASGLYFRERSSTLYTVITAGEAVKVSSHAAGRAVMVELGSAAGRAASCQLAAARQQGVGSAARGISQQRSGGSAVPASDGR
jgi:hypothetical protein